jgi:hypothetical protein
MDVVGRAGEGAVVAVEVKGGSVERIREDGTDPDFAVVLFVTMCAGMLRRKWRQHTGVNCIQPILVFNI